LIKEKIVIFTEAKYRQIGLSKCATMYMIYF